MLKHLHRIIASSNLYTYLVSSELDLSFDLALVDGLTERAEVFLQLVVDYQTVREGGREGRGGEGRGEGRGGRGRW